MAEVGGAQLSIALDHGGRHRVVANHASTIRQVLEPLEACAGVSVLPANGGLLGAMTVAENLALALRYGADPRDESANDWEQSLQLALELCGLTKERLRTLGRERPMNLERVERLMIGLVRSLVRPPELLVLDRIFAGLSRQQSEAVFALEALFHVYHPFRPALFIDIDSHELPAIPDCVSKLSLGQTDETASNSHVYPH